MISQGWSPAVTSKVAAVSIPTPCRVSRSGEVPLGLQAAGGEAEHAALLGIEPLRVIDHRQQRAIDSSVGQQREHAEADKETIRWRPED